MTSEQTKRLDMRADATGQELLELSRRLDALAPAQPPAVAAGDGNVPCMRCALGLNADCKACGGTGYTTTHASVIAGLRNASEAFGGDDPAPSASKPGDGKKDRYRRLLALINKWANENADFDARVEHQIEAALRESSPRHFPAKPGEGDAVQQMRAALIAAEAMLRSARACVKRYDCIDAVIAQVQDAIAASSAIPSASAIRSAAFAEGKEAAAKACEAIPTIHNEGKWIHSGDSMRMECAAAIRKIGVPNA